MVKPAILRFVVKETDFLEQLIMSLLPFHFFDCSERPTEMELFENKTVVQLELLNSELRITNIIQVYLEYAQNYDDVLRVMQFFETAIEELSGDLQEYH
jgi:hypothetical protein